MWITLSYRELKCAEVEGVDLGIAQGTARGGPRETTIDTGDPTAFIIHRVLDAHACGLIRPDDETAGEHAVSAGAYLAPGPDRSHFHYLYAA